MHAGKELRADDVIKTGNSRTSDEDLSLGTVARTSWCMGKGAMNAASSRRVAKNNLKTCCESGAFEYNWAQLLF